MRRHHVTFYSPGTLFAEQTTREIGSWDPKLAAEMAKDVVERYGATPYAFRFSTILTREPVDDGEGGKLNVESKEVAHSGLHFLGGKLETLDDVEARADPKEDILRSNMRCNEHVIVCVRGAPARFRSCIPFGPEDMLCDEEGNILKRGVDPALAEYRRTKVLALTAERLR
jgi:hypothetical protein